MSQGLSDDIFMLIDEGADINFKNKVRHTNSAVLIAIAEFKIFFLSIFLSFILSDIRSLFESFFLSLSLSLSLSLYLFLYISFDQTIYLFLNLSIYHHEP